MRAIAEKNGKVLFVGTKKQAQQIVLDEALRSGAFYINQRWLGGTLTNFRTIQKRIKRLLDIQEMEAAGTLAVYPKKEIAQIKKEEARLENFLGGIKDMKKVPDAVFVVDPTEDYNAVLEAKKLGIPVFAITDTNADPDMIDYGIPANDDAIRSIKIMVSLMADAIVEAKGGILTYAHQEQDLEKDITMSDVIINVNQQNEENERRRRQRMEERRQRDERSGRRPYDRNREGGDRPKRDFKQYTPRPAEKTEATAAPAEVKVETKEVSE
jgi:small subunit ribosomal protein S2